jgi:Ras-related protein Rab-5C
MLGDTCTGKTSLVLRFVEGSYKEERTPTVGAFFITKRLQVENILCKISIWDTAGQPQFRPLAKMYYAHAAAAILCFSYSSRQSWQVTKFWLEELHRNVPAGNIVLCLCACKSDVSPHVVSSKEAQELAAANGAMLVETSAAKDHNVSQVFSKVAERVLQFQKKERETGLGKIPVTPGAAIGYDGQVVKQPHVNRYGVVMEEEKKIEPNAPRRTPSEQPKRRDKRTRSQQPADDEINAPNASMCGIIPADADCTIL